MRIVLFTANGIRHKFLANTLAEHASRALIVPECEPSDAPVKNLGPLSPIQEHFFKRYQAEKEFFPEHDTFRAETLPILPKEVNLEHVYETIKKFSPDLMFAFGCSIIKEPLLSLLPSGHFVNMHLGLSPYYRGSGTNFWPFVNKELEYVGATLLHIDPGIDTGDIIAHVRPDFAAGDTVHTVGCKVIRKGANALVKAMDIVKNGGVLNRVKQWSVSDERYYRKADFNEEVLMRYYKNLEEGMVENYLSNPRNDLRLIDFT